MLMAEQIICHGNKPANDKIIYMLCMIALLRITITETDPLFSASIANGITSQDTANWNNHTIDTQIDSAGIAALGFTGLDGDGDSTNELQQLSFCNR